MTYSKAKLKTLANKLLQLSRDEKETLSSKEVSKVLTAVKKQFPLYQLRPLLKYYLKMVKQALRQEQATIEYAGTIASSDTDSIAKLLSKHYNCAITITEKITPELIAGIKIHIADDVYDTSIAEKLHLIQTKN